MSQPCGLCPCLQIQTLMETFLVVGSCLKSILLEPFPVVQLVNGRVATVAVNSFVFKQPVFIGDLVSFYATIKKIGTTSVTVNVEVFAQRKARMEIVKVTDANLTYVHIDKNGKPKPINK